MDMNIWIFSDWMCLTINILLYAVKYTAHTYTHIGRCECIYRMELDMHRLIQLQEYPDIYIHADQNA